MVIEVHPIRSDADHATARGPRRRGRRSHLHKGLGIPTVILLGIAEEPRAA